MSVVTLPRQPDASAASACLTACRSAGANTIVPPDALGARCLGDLTGAPVARLLGPTDRVVDAWIGGAPGPVQTTPGGLRWRSDGHSLHATVEVDDGALGLEEATRHAYREIFELLGSHACGHLLRVWNYLSDINREAAGVERYRAFNAGRQQAFLDARRSAFDGAPAACALGTRGGPLQVQVLAGRVAPIALENPRQVSAYRYPGAYGARPPTFSRAALASAGRDRHLLLISGTASIVGHASLHAGDVRRQTEESLRNIDALLQVASERVSRAWTRAELVCTLYLRRASDLPAVRAVFEAHVGPHSAAARDAVYLEADICRSDLLVEIEAHAQGSAGE